MELSRNLNKIFTFYLLLFILVFAETSSASNGYLPLQQVQDTVAMDTTGPLPYPFQDQPAFAQPSDTSKLFLDRPSNIQYEVEYDPETGQYIFYEKIGNLNYRLPRTMSLDDYIDYDFEKSIRDYWRQRSRIQDQDNQGGLIPRLTVGGEAFNRVFGGNTIDIQPQGYVEVSFGYQMNATENPAIPERLRRVPTFDFDEKIQMNVMGQIGTKMSMRVNYNTEATFDYENKMNLEYTGEEDEIIKKIEAGNVSLPLNGSLITGASNLFGVKAEMQFGRLTLTTLFSQHKGETQTVETEGGAQITNFEISAADYDANRHFFLSQYFRDQYNTWLRNTAVPLSPININKIEIWVTNKSNNFTDSRNIIAFQDLGAHQEYIYNNIGAFQGITGQPYPENIFPHNDANALYYEMANTYNGIRNTQNINEIMSQFSPSFVGGQDFEKIEQARKLDPSEYTVNERLGYISLNSALNTDEVLAVAYSYTSNGKVFQVGEFSTDGVDAPQTLIMKLLKGTNLSPFLPTWNLMMKNIYNLNAYQLSKEDFELNIVYQNDSTGTYINYIPEGEIAGRILLKVMNLDKLNKQLDPTPDGVFDYIPGITVNPSTGRIIFPVLQPFGDHLADSLRNPALIEEYAFQTLYDSTQVIAEQDAEHNKFLLTGSYKGSSSSDISLGTLNVAQGSVKVTAGGRELTENVDYTVDYTLGTVKIINQALLEAGTPIQVSTESEDLFTMQRKTLMGTHANYAFSDNFNIGATALYMHERPLTQKVDYGEDPISNLMVGMDARYSTESMFLTKAVDALPFYSTKTPSTIDFEAEIAQLIPGHSNVIEESGNAYIDDFEGTKTTINLKTRQSWTLASTPQHQPELFPEGNLNSDRAYGYNRAKLAYYIIDPLFLRNNSLTPDHIRNNVNLQSNHLVREVFEKEIFPARESPVGQPTNIPVFDLAFYPTERGQYNYDVDPTNYSAGVNPDGSLKEPESRWGGIMRPIETSDFENSNIEFIEFWMMDPFVNDTTGDNEGGNLYFNLGDISEDILKDSRKAFENGLPTTDQPVNLDTTIWGRISTLQSLVNAFENEGRQYQDVGLDGLGDEDENSFYADFLNRIQLQVVPEAYQQIQDDPSSDNFHYYRGSDYDQQQVGILERYKDYNGMDGNSPTTEMSEEPYPTAESTIPDIEDINSDNTLNEYERYYQYKIDIEKGQMQVGQNYITDIKESRVELKNGQVSEVKWYQFKIPVRDPDKVVGNIRDFRSIRFMRMFLKGFEEPTVLRFATLDLVRADWRRYSRNLGDVDANSPNAEFDVSAVNIEENGNRHPVNYILPPDISRVIDPANPQLRQLNEQSMLLKVTNLAEGDARAAYKSLYMDFRRYNKLKLEVHAEEIEDHPLEDDEMYFFIRLGSDYNFNYYEYEVPLSLTPHLPENALYNGEIESDRYIVWPDANRINLPLEVLTNAKLDRNAEMRRAGSTIGIQDVYETVHRGWNKDKNRVKIKGSPNLANVEVIMMGIRNKRGQVNTGPKSVEVWVNELRLTDFDEEGGWAANARMTTRLADLGSITLAGRTRSSGFAGISQSINNRPLEDVTEYDVASSIDLGQFFPEKAGVRIPMYYGYSQSVSEPKYNPLEPDIELDKSLERAESDEVKDSIKFISQDLVTRKSINFTNVKVEPQTQKEKVHLWDPSNFAVTYSYNETFRRNINTEYNLNKTYRGMFSYNYSSRPKIIQPFNSVNFLRKSPLNLIGDFNFYPLPTQISFRTDLFRRYREVKSRNITNPNFVLPVTYEKDFLWNRFFDLRYDVTRSIKLDFSSRSTARIDEPEGRINKNDDDYQMKKDSILNNLWELGRPVLYNHNVNVSYNLPINRINLLSFLSSSIRYRATYDWQAGPITADTINLGNQIQNSRNIQLTGNANLTTLYNKVPYFKELNEKFRRTGRGRGSLNRRSQGGRNQAQAAPQRKQVSTHSSNVTLAEGQSQQVKHNLNTRKVKVVATNVDGDVVPGKTNIVDANTIEFTPVADASQAQIVVSGVEGDQGFLKDMLDLTVRMLIGVRTVSVNYSISGGTVLPGYLPEPTVFGAGNYTPRTDLFNRNIAPSFAPGMPFLLGWQDYDFAQRAASNGWITTDSTLNTPYGVSKSERFNFRAVFEPLPDLRIDITADRTFSTNTTEFYNYNPRNGLFEANSFSERGNFSMSTLTWGTAFFAIGQGEVNQSETFEKFKEYRLTIANRLAAQRGSDNGFGYNPADPHPVYPSYPDGYGPNSVEVMVPAFLAAYQNKDPESISLGLFPSIKFVRPNWRVKYEGMASRIPWLNRYIRSLNFTHSYRSSYSVGSFITDLTYEEQGDGFSYVRDIANNFIAPYDFNSVSIMETFSPLINVDVMWVGDLTTRGEVRRSRNLMLSFANNQLTEIMSNEYTVGMGYRFKQMDLIIKTKNSQQAYSNDLNLRADFSYRKNKTVLRKIVEDDDQLTAGQSAFTIKTTADYMLSDRFQLRVFFDKVLNNPFTSLSFPTSNTNIGVSFRFTLAQ